MIRVWMVTFSEWDLGMDKRVFSSKEVLLSKICMDGTDFTIEEGIADGLLVIEEIIIEE